METVEILEAVMIYDNEYLITDPKLRLNQAKMVRQDDRQNGSATCAT